MNHSQNYYAARAAAFAEVREQLLAEAEAAERPQLIDETDKPYRWEDLKSAGKTVEVVLGWPFGERAGEVLECTYLWPKNVSHSFWVGRLFDERSRQTWFVEVVSYSKRDDIYNMVLRVDAII